MSNEALTCDFCDSDLSDWVGNVVIPAKELQSSVTVTKVRVECKKCARLREANDWHSIWELSWIAKQPVRYAFQIAGSQTSAFEREPPTPRYSEDALNDFLRIFYLIHPDLIGGGPFDLEEERNLLPLL